MTDRLSDKHRKKERQGRKEKKKQEARQRRMTYYPGREPNGRSPEADASRHF
jgi:hypothetical protein